MYSNMIGLLIEAIKEQQKQIDELRGKLNADWFSVKPYVKSNIFNKSWSFALLTSNLSISLIIEFSSSIYEIFNIKLIWFTSYMKNGLKNFLVKLFSSK